MKTGSLCYFLDQKINSRSAVVGVVGLGYVGLPLAIAAAQASFPVYGFDTDNSKINKLYGGISYIDGVASEDVKKYTKNKKLIPTGNLQLFSQCDIIIICVPTPLTHHRDPDLQYVESTTRNISQHMKPGATIVLESTTWPWTTETVVKTIIESEGRKSGEDFFLGFSPEREDPGNRMFKTTTIPKIVSGDGDDALHIITLFYSSIFEEVVPVSSPRVAEAVKITENIFRSVNIALVNELKIIYDAMDIDVWEVINAAATKPFGYMPFYPGPGLGGHCIPIDPFYLAWKAREFQIPTRFIELAGEINIGMPSYVLSRLERELDRRQKKSLSSARILIVGLAYKKNVSDIRESPALALMDLLDSRNTHFDYYDPYVPMIPITREYIRYYGIESIDINEGSLESYDAIVLVTDHDNIDYEMIANSYSLIVDTRNAFEKHGIRRQNIVKA